MPQLNPAFFPTQLFWLAVCFVVFFLLMWRLALPRVATIMQQRQERIAGDLDRAAQLKRDAEEVVAAYEASLAEARAKAQALYRETSDAISAVAAKQQAEAGQAITARTLSGGQQGQILDIEVPPTKRAITVEEQ